MADRFNVTLSVHVKTADTGAEYAASDTTYFDVPYEVMLAIEKAVAGAMVSLGEAGAKAKKG